MCLVREHLKFRYFGLGSLVWIFGSRHFLGAGGSSYGAVLLIRVCRKINCLCVERWKKKEKGKSIISEQLLRITILYLKLRFNEDLSSCLYIFPQIFDEWIFFQYSVHFPSNKNHFLYYYYDYDYYYYYYSWMKRFKWRINALCAIIAAVLCWLRSLDGC